MQAGLVRDGHGDLLADDIFCLPDGPRALDCLDFDDQLRWMDGLDDVACLAMDLERLGDPGAGKQLLRYYAEFSGNAQPESLRHHYIAYRAVMRAKIAALRAAERGEAGAQDADEASLLCDIGLRHLQAGQPLLILVGGVPGSGKTSLAHALADLMHAAVMSSDRVRKELSGVPPNRHAAARFNEGIYGPESTQRTYAWLASRARELLDLGETVIVDATFSDAGLRTRFREVAARSRAAAVELQCVAPPSTVRARLLARETHPDALSDAGISVGHRISMGFEAWPEAATVDASGSCDAAASFALETVTQKANGHES
jgi:predicted kinase